MLVMFRLLLEGLYYKLLSTDSTRGPIFEIHAVDCPHRDSSTGILFFNVRLVHLSLDRTESSLETFFCERCRVTTKVRSKRLFSSSASCRIGYPDWAGFRPDYDKSRFVAGARRRTFLPRPGRATCVPLSPLPPFDISSRAAPSTFAHFVYVKC